jgi:hypothetical protein
MERSFSDLCPFFLLKQEIKLYNFEVMNDRYIFNPLKIRLLGREVIYKVKLLIKKLERKTY